jgi:hypothetical protein
MSAGNDRDTSIYKSLKRLLCSPSVSTSVNQGRQRLSYFSTSLLQFLVYKKMTLKITEYAWEEAMKIKYENITTMIKKKFRNK